MALKIFLWGILLGWLTWSSHLHSVRKKEFTEELFRSLVDQYLWLDSGRRSVVPGNRRAVVLLLSWRGAEGEAPSYTCSQSVYNFYRLLLSALPCDVSAPAAGSPLCGEVSVCMGGGQVSSAREAVGKVGMNHCCLELRLVLKQGISLPKLPK